MDAAKLVKELVRLRRDLTADRDKGYGETTLADNEHASLDSLLQKVSDQLDPVDEEDPVYKPSYAAAATAGRPLTVLQARRIIGRALEDLWHMHPHLEILADEIDPPNISPPRGGGWGLDRDGYGGSPPPPHYRIPAKPEADIGGISLPGRDPFGG